MWMKWTTRQITKILPTSGDLIGDGSFIWIGWEGGAAGNSRRVQSSHWLLWPPLVQSSGTPIPNPDDPDVFLWLCCLFLRYSNRSQSWVMVTALLLGRLLTTRKEWGVSFRRVSDRGSAVLWCVWGWLNSKDNAPTERWTRSDDVRNCGVEVGRFERRYEDFQRWQVTRIEFLGRTRRIRSWVLWDYVLLCTALQLWNGGTRPQQIWAVPSAEFSFSGTPQSENCHLSLQRWAFTTLVCWISPSPSVGLWGHQIFLCSW